MAESERELEGVVKNLAACLAARLGLDPPSPAGLDAGLAAALGKRLGIKGEVTMLGLLARMGDFGLDLAHIEVERLENKELLHEYFLLDLALVLIDSIDQVKAARAAGVVLDSFGVDGSVGGSSGGEEVSKILEKARAKYGRVTTSFKSGLDKADISFIPPSRTKNQGPVVKYSTKQKQPPPQTFPSGAESELGETQSTDIVGGDTTDFKDVLDLGTLKSKAQPRPKRRKLSKDAVKKIRQAKENVSNIVKDGTDDDVGKDDHEINVNIPISDTTDVKIKVKPLDNRELRSQRIHVRVNQRKTPAGNKIKSRHIAYGSKNVVSHHLRKTRPPLFSKKPPTPRLDRKQVLERVVSEVKKKRAKEEIGDQENELVDDASKVRDFQLQAQKVLREKRTKNAQFRKLMQKL